MDANRREQENAFAFFSRVPFAIKKFRCVRQLGQLSEFSTTDFTDGESTSLLLLNPCHPRDPLSKFLSPWSV